MGFRKFVNTRYFSEAANEFKKNKGIYCKAPEGTREFDEFWDEQERRCKYGYQVGDTKITGKHYFYLNFTQMKKVSDEDRKNKIKVGSGKIMDFPSFWEIDYEWWWAKEIAWKGIKREELVKLQVEALKLRDYAGGNHLGCLKTRRAGFSYKEAVDGVFNYNFIPDSKSYYFASLEQYLTTDGILNKVESCLSFLNKNTQGVWYKNRMKKKTLMHQRASYIDEYGEENGFLSEIIGVIIDDPDKVRGKDGLKITYEEAGSFKNLKQALAISVPSIRDGSTITGQISVFGTGGEEGDDIEGLDDIFNHPYEYDMLPFLNRWEEGLEGTECGNFVPCYAANQDFMDENGNVDIEAALADDEKERDKKRRLKDPKELDRRVAEFPRTPSEALLRTNSKTFPIAEAKAQLRFVEKSVLGTLLHGNLVYNENGLEFEIDPKAKPILKYPHKQDDDLTGCITIVEKPIKDSYGMIPGKKRGDFYFITVDPFYNEDAEDVTSLFSVYVWKRGYNKYSNVDKRVAWYHCRTKKDIINLNLFKLAEYYGATIQSEIAGGGADIIAYARLKKKLDYLEYEPEMWHNKELESNTKNKSYFMNMPEDRKRNGITYYADWLTTIIGMTEDGREIWNLHNEYDPGLLEEIIKYTEDKNVDRISSSILGMFMLKEKAVLDVMEKRKKNPNSVFNRPWFTDQVTTNFNMRPEDMIMDENVYNSF